MNVLVIGASRGLGLEFVRQYREAGDAVTVSARDDAGLERLRGLRATPIRLDVVDAASASSLAWQIEGARFDVAIVNAGVSGQRVAALEPPAQENFDAVMHANVLGPMRVIAQIAAASEDISAGATEMQDTIAEVAAVAEQTSAATEQVSASAQQTSASVSEIASSASEMAANAQKLAELFAASDRSAATAGTSGS